MKKDKLEGVALDLSKINHDLLVAMQAAWIEWRHGKGADAAMQWIENTLSGPGLIPPDNAPWSTEAQAWFDANKHDPFPRCYCGRPSNQLWMGRGFCSVAHYEAVRAANPEGASNA